MLRSIRVTLLVSKTQILGVIKGEIVLESERDEREEEISGRPEEMAE